MAPTTAAQRVGSQTAKAAPAITGKIILEKATKTYCGGEAIEGYIVISNDKPLQVKGIHLIFEGVCITLRKDKTAPAKTLNLILAVDEFLKEKLNILGNVGETYTTIPGGSEHYPFRFVLPLDLPSNYVATTASSGGTIRYEIACVITLPGEKDKELKVSVPFCVTGLLDLNRHPAAQHAVVLTKRRSTGCVFFQGTIGFDFKMPKRAFAVGDFVPFQVEITNDSDKVVSANVCIVRKALHKYTVGRNTDCPPETETEVCCVQGPSLSPGADEVWSDDTSLKLPDFLAPTNLGGKCRLIDVTYALKIKLVWSSRFNFPASLESGTSILIGTVPFGEVPAYGTTTDQDLPPPYQSLVDFGSNI